VVEPEKTVNGSPSRSAVQSIDRAVAILRCFDSRHPTLGITEIAQLTGLSTSTAHRILMAMAANRLVRQTPDRRYGLGPLLSQLARNGAMSTTFRDIALPFMTGLRDEVDETVGLHTLLSSGERAVIDQVESHQELRRRYTDIGVPVPLHLGAPGRAILSMLPWERQEWWLSQPIERVTPAQIVEPELIRIELARTRERGWAHSNAERTIGIRAIAAPVFDHTGGVMGAIGLSVPTVRINDERAEQLGRRTRDVALELSEALGAPADARERALKLARGPQG
jgi:IclR family acetate operon transcriptional repressor